MPMSPNTFSSRVCLEPFKLLLPACTCQTATQKTATEKQRPQNSDSLTIATVSSATAKTATHTLERLIKTAIGSTATMKNSDCPNIERLLSSAVNSFSPLTRLLRFVGFTWAIDYLCLGGYDAPKRCFLIDFNFYL